MSSLYQIQNRYKLGAILVIAVVLILIIFWAVEFYYSLKNVSQDQEQFIQEHQNQKIDRKAEQFRILFHEINQSARTISLLPMVRSLNGYNRTSEEQDIVKEGRFSLDAHRTLQQLYTNLQNNVRVSEVYFVLDGFNPEKDIPVFMYDDFIAGVNTPESDSSLIIEDIPEELEEEEYKYFPVQLNWFRRNTPEFIWTHSLDKIPVRLSPLLRTCDNQQYESIKHGQVTDSYGIIYALPVYSNQTNRFKGMITVVLRENILEALLLDVPFIPVTGNDKVKQRQQGWKMPAISMFQLAQEEYGIVIKDRRNKMFNSNGHLMTSGRWMEKEYELSTGIVWKLKHYLTPSVIEEKSLPFIDRKNYIVVTRLLIIIVFTAVLMWITRMINRSRKELLQRAYYDSLTSLPNRTQLFDCINHRINSSRNARLKFSILIINLTNFSSVNQHYGYIAGDHLLKLFAERLNRILNGGLCKAISEGVSLDNNTLIARLSGDEFAVVTSDYVNKYDILKLIKILQPELLIPFVLDNGVEIKINVNIGVSIFPHDATTSSSLVSCADTALQESRRIIGDNYYLFDDELRLRCEKLHHLTETLKGALEKNQFEIVYQPKQRLKDNRVISLEALLRWRHPEFGLVSPLEFIPILEQSNGIIEVGYWVIEQACLDLADLTRQGFDDIAISVNVSVNQLHHENFHLDVGAILEKNSIEPRRLILEITESIMMENIEESIDILNHLNEQGFPIAIDDFGTGYSSLTYLQNLPIT
ncbi:MAG: EAL domain-containing protein, partial [Gammaproteobacteria bacterium]|nr:EAL domain-containing protein [Gammaproteobacteria bacterium]